MTRLPLTHWTLHGRDLPERLLSDRPTGFSLPGAAALSAFAELLGTPDAPAGDDAPAEGAAPFALPAMLPDDVPGPVRLTREIDFGGLRGDRALLELDLLAGRGELLLDDQVLARFDSASSPAASIAAAAGMTGTPCMLAVDLTEALHLGRRRTLTLCFAPDRPAGVCSPVFLVTTARAHLARTALLPNARASAVSLRTQICAQQAGSYVLRVRPIPSAAGAHDASAREISLSLAAGEMREAALTLAFEAEPFVPGQAYAPSAVKVQLFFRPAGSAKEGPLCDEALLMCGYPPRNACAFVPLTAQDCAGHPGALADRLAALHIPAVCPPGVLTDAACRALCRAGIAVRQFVPGDSPLRPLLARCPGVILCDAPPVAAPLSPEAASWQLCAMTAYPCTVDATLTPGELLAEATGRALNADSEGVRSVLAWLVAVGVRLRAEAARQGRFSGSLCAPGALESGDVRDALRTAFAPLHLSALPLYGAWWTGTHFSATLHALIPPRETRSLTACAMLEDENGEVLSRLSAPCNGGGFVGVLEAALPARPCVLTLVCRILCEDACLEESTLPVYVGERGPLEAAFL